MLKDRFFYPLAFTMIAAMILYALSFGTNTSLSDECIWANGFESRGDQLVKLTASPGTKYNFIGQTPNDPAYVIALTEIARKDAPPSAGIFATLSSDYERAFAEQELRVTIRARQGRNNPLTEFDMGYFTAGAGDSGWKKRELTNEWQDYVLDFKPGLPTADADIDYLGFWPGREGEQKTMNVSVLKIDVLSREESMPPNCPAL